MGNLVLVRHGESHGNVDAKHWLDDTINFLTIQGTTEALGCGTTLRHAMGPFDVVFSSKYTRAKHTARVIMEVVRHEGPYLRDPRFNEIGYNEANGEKAESFDQLRRRVMEAHVELIQPYVEKNANILVVSHYHTLKQYMGALTGVPMSGPDKFSPRHAIPYVIDIVNGKLTDKHRTINFPSS